MKGNIVAFNKKYGGLMKAYADFGKSDSEIVQIYKQLPSLKDKIQECELEFNETFDDIEKTLNEE